MMSLVHQLYLKVGQCEQNRKWEAWLTYIHLCDLKGFVYVCVCVLNAPVESSIKWTAKRRKEGRKRMRQEEGDGALRKGGQQEKRKGKERGKMWR